MKRAIKVLLAILLATVMVVAVAACTPTEKDPCANGHSWDDGQKVTADCTQPGKLVRHCKVCGASWETDLAAGEHTWGEYKVTKAPTCTEDGTETRTCLVCGKTEDQTITSDGHVWGEFKVTKAPTCTEDGLETRTCSVCGETDQKTLPAAHSWGEVTVTKAPTCKQPGIGSAQCTVCGEHSDSIEIPATGIHSWNDGSVTKAPDCETAGVLTYTCTVCGDTTTQSLPANGHAYGRLIPQADATCTENGTKAHYQCSVCGKLFDEFKTSVSASDLVIRSTGHSLSERLAKAATCTEEGYEAYYQCRRCNKLFADDDASQPIDAPVATPKADHTPQPYGAKAATCTQQGATAGSKCAVCGKILITPKATPALGHEFYYVEHDEQETHTERCRRCDHSVEQACIPDTQWAANDDYHWHTCLLCDGEVDRAVHSTESGSKQCTICGREIGEVVVRVDGADDKICTGVKTAIEYISETYPNGDVTATIVINADRDGDGVTIEGNIHVVIDLSNLVYKISKGTTIVGGQADVTFTNGTVDGKITYKGGTLRFSEVDSTKLIIDMNGATCDDAEIYFDGVLRTHSAVEGWQVDETARKHYHVCAYCSARIDESACVTENKYDNSDHWSECTTCHEKYDLAGHTMAYQNTAPGTHKHYCTECDYVDESDTVCTPDSGDTNHDQTHGLDGGWYADADFHWRKCAKCGEEYGKEAHQFDKKESGGLCKDCGHKFFDVKISDGNGLDQSAPTIAEAFAWIETNGVAGRTYTVTLTHNRSDASEATVTVPAGYTIVLDLAGHTVTYTKGNLSIEDGSLEIKGDENSFKVKAIVYGGGTLKLPAGEYKFEFDNNKNCDNAEITIGGAKLAHKWSVTKWNWAESYNGTGLPTVSVDVKCDFCSTTHNVTATAKQESRNDSTCEVQGTAQFSATATYDRASFATEENKEYTLALAAHQYTNGKYAHIEGTWQHQQVCDVCGKPTGKKSDCSSFAYDSGFESNYCTTCNGKYAQTDILDAIKSGKLKPTSTDKFFFKGIVYDKKTGGGTTPWYNIWFYVDNNKEYSFEAYAVSLNGKVAYDNIYNGAEVIVSGTGDDLMYDLEHAHGFEFYETKGENICKVESYTNKPYTVSTSDNHQEISGSELEITLTDGEGNVIDTNKTYNTGTLVKVKVTVSGAKIVSVTVGDKELSYDADEGVYAFYVEGPSEIIVTIGGINVPSEQNEYTWKASDNPETVDGTKWEESGHYLSANLGGIAEATVEHGKTSTNTGAYNSKTNWRLYQSENNTLTIKPKAGYAILSVTIYYENNDSGELYYGEGLAYHMEHMTNNNREGTLYTLSGEEQTKGVTFTVKSTSSSKTSGKVFIFQIDITYKYTTNHQFGELIPGSAPSCETPGVVAHYECSNPDHAACRGKYFDEEGNVIESVEIPAKGQHGLVNGFETIPQQDATCTEEGHVAYYKCKDCGQLFSDAGHVNKIDIDDVTTIPALGHDVQGVPFTDIGDGNHGQKCKRQSCDDYDNIGAHTIETCYDETDHWQGCKKCGYVQGAKVEHDFGTSKNDITCHDCNAPNPNHKHVWGTPVSKKDATCTEDGNPAYVQCTGCLHYFSDDESHTTDYGLKAPVDEATGHDFNGVDFTPILGENMHGKLCKNGCGTYDERTKAAHEYTIVGVRVDATYHEASCVCGDKTLQQVHNFKDDQGGWLDKCACGENRLSEESKSATVGSSLSFSIGDASFVVSNGATNAEHLRIYANQTVTIKSTTPFVKIEFKSVQDSDYSTSHLTINSGGGTLNYDSNIGTYGAQVWTAQDNIPITSLELKASKQARCTEIVVYFITCPHTWVNNGEPTQQPDCKTEQNGKQPQICIRCGEIRTYETPFAHEYGEEIPVSPANCTESGVKAHYHCSKCEQDFIKDEDGNYVKASAEDLKLNATGHTATDAGWQTRLEGDVQKHYKTCKTCGVEFDVGECATTQEWVTTPDQHKHICDTCNKDFDVGDHDKANDGACSKCGYTTNSVEVTIGEQVSKVEDLQAAFNQAASVESDVTIKLTIGLEGTTLTYNGSANVTLDLNSLTYTATSISIGGSGVLTVTGGTIKANLIATSGGINLHASAVIDGDIMLTVGSALALNVDSTSSVIGTIKISSTKGNAANLTATFDADQVNFAEKLSIEGGAVCTDFTQVKFNHKTISHNYVDQNNGNHKCEICENSETHNWKVVVLTEGWREDTHDLICEDCNATKTEAHKSSDTCDCGYVKSVSKEPITISITIKEVASDKGWVDAERYFSIQMDDVIKIESNNTDGQNGYYSKSSSQWRFYKNDSGGVTISAASGYNLVSVKITYSANNSGQLKDSSGSGVASKTVVNCESLSDRSKISFTVGVSSGTKNGQVRITEVEVIYIAS